MRWGKRAATLQERRQWFAWYPIWLEDEECWCWLELVTPYLDVGPPHSSFPLRCYRKTRIKL